jgi:Skp family chaperone for outer membrane proteins
MMAQRYSNPIVVAILAALLGYTWAQQAPGLRGADTNQPERFPVAVVDMARVLNSYKQLTERKEEQQREFQKAEEAAKLKVEEGRRLQEELKGVKEGSGEHKRIVAELQARTRDFEQFRRQQQHSLLEGQAKALLWAYERVLEQVQQHADAHGIKLVIQLNPVPVEGKPPQEIIGGLNRQVIYQNALDITDEIIQALN